MEIKSNTLINKEATFILKNNTDVDYAYDDYYIIERFDKKENWVDLDLIIDWTPRIEPQVYTIKSKEEHEIYIEWSSIYGEFNSGTYRIVKTILEKQIAQIQGLIVFIQSFRLINIAIWDKYGFFIVTVI